MKQKMLAYVVRWEAGGWQLLVFEHALAPEAGLQVPAGTVESGEPLETALWREIFEESGLQPPQVEMIAKLAETLEPDLDQLRHIYLLQAVAALPAIWRHVVAGAGEDQGLVFVYRWDELSHQLRLAGRQDRWLALIEPSLSQAQARS